MTDEYHLLWTPERSISTDEAESIIESINHQVTEQTGGDPTVERVETFGIGSVAGPFLISVAGGLAVEALRQAFLAYSGTSGVKLYVKSELDTGTDASVSVEADGVNEIEVEVDVTTGDRKE